MVVFGEDGWCTQGFTAGKAYRDMIQWEGEDQNRRTYVTHSSGVGHENSKEQDVAGCCILEHNGATIEKSQTRSEDRMHGILVAKTEKLGEVAMKIPSVMMSGGPCECCRS